MRLIYPHMLRPHRAPRPCFTVQVQWLSTVQTFVPIRRPNSDISARRSLPRCRLIQATWATPLEARSQICEHSIFGPTSAKLPPRGVRSDRGTFAEMANLFIQIFPFRLDISHPHTPHKSRLRQSQQRPGWAVANVARAQETPATLPQPLFSPSHKAARAKAAIRLCRLGADVRPLSDRLGLLCGSMPLPTPGLTLNLMIWMCVMRSGLESITRSLSTNPSALLQYIYDQARSALGWPLGPEGSTGMSRTQPDQGQGIPVDHRHTRGRLTA